MNDLTPINAKPLATTASVITTPALWRRLTDASVSWSEAVEGLSKDSAARAELTLVVDELARHVEPCGPAVILDELTPLLALYNVPRKPPAEAEVFWGFYMDALGSLPAEAVRKGVAEYVADAKSEFFPKPGPLKAICERHAVPLRMAANRAQRALASR
jgi:hypothetical protein